MTAENPDLLHEVRELRREFAEHVADDLEILKIVRSTDLFLRGDLSHPESIGLVQKVDRLTTKIDAAVAVHTERGVDRRFLVGAVVSILTTFIMSGGALAAVLFK